MDWPWAGLRILVAQWSGWTPAPQCCYIPMPHPSQSPSVTLGAHLHCWGRGDLFPGSSPLEREITEKGNKVFTKRWTQKLVDKTLPPSSYPGCEESLWTPGSTSVGLLWGSPGSSGNLYHKMIISLEQVWVRLQEPQVSPLITCCRDLVSWCCVWSFLWWSYSWSYLLHTHHIDPPAGLKQSAHHNLHATWGDRKPG